MGFEYLEQRENKEIQNEPIIHKRSDWDNENASIQGQYSKTIGDKYKIKLNGQEIERTVDVLNYMEFTKNGSNVTQIKALPENELYKAYRRIVVHHTLINNSGKTPIQQAMEIRDLQIGSMGFNDIAYHFIIATDGTILEGRPLDRVGSHAGQSVEANSSARDGGRKLPDIIYEKSTKNGVPVDPQGYKNALGKFDDAMRKDPD